MTNSIAAPTPCPCPAKGLTRRRGRPCRDAVAMPREDILRQAFTAFAREGYDGVSLRNLAGECGVSDSLISHHFGSKRDLWFEATDSVFQPLFNQLMALLDALSRLPGNNAVAILQQNLPQSLKLVAANPVAVQFLFREGEGDNERSEYLRMKYVRPYLARIDGLFEQAQAAGHYRKVSPASRHALVFGLLRSLAIPGVMIRELAPQLSTPEGMSRFIDDAVTVLYHGLSLNPQDNSAGTPA
ncbi:MAG: TetR/AcrR family transcriptional regulator [Pseudomonadota bacterium]